MSESQTPTSQKIATSLGQELAEAGFKKTPLAKVISELIGSYLDIHSSLSPRLSQALKTANSGVTELVPNIPATNDDSFNTNQAA